MESTNDNKDVNNDNNNVAVENNDETKSFLEIRNDSVLQLDVSDGFDTYLDKVKANSDDLPSTTNVDEKEVPGDEKNVDNNNSEEGKSQILPIDEQDLNKDNLNIVGSSNQFSCIDYDDHKKTEETALKNKVNDAKNKDKTEKSNLNCIWVYNISKTTKATDLKSHLSRFGKIISAKIVTDGEKCYGYAILNKYDDLKRCINNLNNTYFEGKKIKLSIETPEKESKKEIDKRPAKLLTEKPKRTSRESSATRNIKPRCYSRERRRERPSGNFKQHSKNKSRESSREKVRRISRFAIRERSRERLEIRKRYYEDLQETKYRKELEFKLSDTRKKLEKEKELFQKEKLQLLKLRKLIAEYERIDIQKQTDLVKKEARELEENLIKCKSSEISRKISEINRKYYPPSPPKKMVRYEEKKMHVSPPPPPNICKEALEHKLTKRRYEDEKMLNDERSFQRYQYNGKQQDHYKDPLHHNVFNKYHQISNKKSTELPRCNNQSSIQRNVTWKPMSSSTHHVEENYPSEYWKDQNSNANQRYRPNVNESTNYSPSFYHYPEYSRYGYHDPDNGRKY